MKKIICIALSVIIMCLTGMVAVAAKDTPVLTYDGQTKQFVFDGETNDLFPALKSVIPGQSFAQDVKVKNNSANNVDVKLYVRSTGADQASQDLLSKLDVSVKEKGGNKLFETVKEDTTKETDWVCLGLFKSGASIDLEITIFVPVELGNEYQDASAKLGYEFKAEEFPIEEPVEDKPVVPSTGDTWMLVLYIALFVISLAVIIGVIVVGKKNKKKDQK